MANIELTDQPRCYREGHHELQLHMGDRVVVLPGVTIGDHAIIGANAVVTRDVPPYSIVVGPSAQCLPSRN